MEWVALLTYRPGYRLFRMSFLVGFVNPCRQMLDISYFSTNASFQILYISLKAWANHKYLHFDIHSAAGERLALLLRVWFSEKCRKTLSFPGQLEIPPFYAFFLPCRGPSLHLSVCQYETAGEPLKGFSLSLISMGFLKIYRHGSMLVNEQRLMDTLH